MSSDDEITALTKTPDSEDEMTRIPTEVLQPRGTHPTELSGAFPDLESELEFVSHQLTTVDQAGTNEPPTQPTELPAVTDSIVIATKRVPPQTGSIVPYESSAVSELDVNHIDGTELQVPSAEADPCQIAAPVCQNLPAFPTHQLGECSAEPAQSHDVSAFSVDNYSVTPEDLDELHAARDYLLKPTAIPYSEFHDLTAGSLVDHPNNEALTHAEPDATEEAICLPHQPIATLQFGANASEFSNLTDNTMAPFAVSEQNDVHVHIISGAMGPYHRAEDLDEFHASQDYLLEPTAIPDSETSHPASEFHDLTASSLVDHPNTESQTHAEPDATEEDLKPDLPASEFHDLTASSLVNHPNNEALIHAEPDATEEAICLAHQPITTPQFGANASEFSNLTDNTMAPFAITEQNDVQVHTISGAIGPYHRAVSECQNLSASPTHQHDESYTQPTPESLDIAMNFTDSNPVSEEDLQTLQEALSCVCEPPSPSYFDIHVPASPDLTESSMAHSPVSRSLTDTEKMHFRNHSILLINPLQYLKANHPISEFSSLTGNNFNTCLHHRLVNQLKFHLSQQLAP